MILLERKKVVKWLNSKNKYKILTFLLLNISCSTKKNLNKFTIEDGVIVEKKDSTKQIKNI